MFSDFALAFMPASWHKRIEEQEKEYFENVLVHQAEPWNEDKSKFKKELVIEGKSWKPYRLFNSPSTRPGTPAKKLPPKVIVPCPGASNTYFYINRIILAGHKLELIQNKNRGFVYFTSDVVSPVLCRYSRFEQRGYDVVMGITPMEIMTQRQGIRLATGTVLVGGLGLGWFLSKVCDKRSVKNVIVVEKEQVLLDWIKPTLMKKNENVRNKVSKWICDDVYKQIGKHGENTRHLLDIWDRYGTFDMNFERAKRAVKYLWGWGQVELGD